MKALWCRLFGHQIVGGTFPPDYQPWVRDYVVLDVRCPRCRKIVSVVVERFTRTVP